MAALNTRAYGANTLTRSRTESGATMSVPAGQYIRMNECVVGAFPWMGDSAGMSWPIITARIDATEPARDDVRAALAARGDAQLAELIDQLPVG